MNGAVPQQEMPDSEADTVPLPLVAVGTVVKVLASDGHTAHIGAVKRMRSIDDQGREREQARVYRWVGWVDVSRLVPVSTNSTKRED